LAKVYHLDLDRKMLEGSKVALLPGDPARVASIAEAVAGTYGARIKKLASKREFTTFLLKAGAGARRGKNTFPVVVTSTGIGGPSASIVIDELAQLGVKTFIRIGTTGAIQRYIKTGDCVITTGSVRLDGASTHYAPVEFPAVADHGVTGARIKGAEDAGVKYHVGVSASSDTFYPGEERDDSYREYTLRRFVGSTVQWRSLGVLNYEMESSTILTLTASMGLKGGCITGVVNRGGTGRVTEKALKLGVENAVRAAAAALAHL
jgi:uridine phosphorylase